MGPEELYGYGALWVHALVGVVEGVHEDVATPCPSWRARDVVAHLVEGNHRAAAVIRQRAEERAPHPPPASLRERYRGSAGEVLMAFRECMALSQHVTVDGRTTDGEEWYRLAAAEQWVHGWDLARALEAAGAQGLWPTEVDGVEVAAMQEAVAAAAALGPLAGLHAEGEVAAPFTAAADAPALDRLAAAFGRAPHLGAVTATVRPPPATGRTS